MTDHNTSAESVEDVLREARDRASNWKHGAHPAVTGEYMKEVCDRIEAAYSRERANSSESPKGSLSIAGTITRVGNDEDGQPRIVVHTTREAITACAANLLGQSVEVALAAGNYPAEQDGSFSGQGEHEARALARCESDLREMIEAPDDYGLDEMQVASLQTAVESINFRRLTSSQPRHDLENRLELAKEDIEAFHLAMDGAGVPRSGDEGELSMFGRACVFASSQPNSSETLTSSQPAVVKDCLTTQQAEPRNHGN